MKLTLKVFFCSVAAILMAASCNKQTKEAKPDAVRIRQSCNPEQLFDAIGGEVNINFISTNDWHVEVADPWLTVTPRSGTGGSRMVTLKVQPYEGYERRTTTATVISGSATLVLTAIQKAKVEGSLYKVVAHRGGYLENGCAEGSIAAMKASIAQRCYAVECDAMWTADNDIVLCHPDDQYMINGLVPSASTLAQIRAAGKLTNGEQMPSLADFLAVLADKNSNPLGTKLWIDVKGNTTDLQDKVMKRAAEIAKEMNACEFVEMLVPYGYSAYASLAATMKSQYGINCAWNGRYVTPGAYGNGGWCQVPYGNYRVSEFWPPTGYFNAGVTVSIYQTPSSASSYTSFYNDIKEYYPQLKAIFVNHPQYIIEKLIKDGLEAAQ